MYPLCTLQDVLWVQVPPDGEFPIMNYRMTQEFKPPFKVYPVIEEKGPFKVMLAWLRAHDISYICIFGSSGV